jgi:hypothetical protein
VKSEGDSVSMVCVRKLVLAFGTAALLAACGGSDPSDENNTTGGVSAQGGASGGSGAPGGTSGGPALGNLLPWKEGNWWAYKVTDDEGVVTQKRTTVGPVEMVGGTGPNKDKLANKVTTHKDDTGDGIDLDETVSWQAVEGDRVVRYREQSFDKNTKQLDLEEYWSPSKLHVDSSAQRTAPPFNWLEEYLESKLPAGGEPVYDRDSRDRWFAERMESVTVPAGTFEALVLRKVSGSSTSSANQKSYWYVPGVGKVKETGSQTEELTEYHLE